MLSSTAILSFPVRLRGKPLDARELVRVQSTAFSGAILSMVMHPSVLSLEFLVKIANIQRQILRLTIPKLKSVWGPFPHPSDEDLSPGTPVRSG